MYISRRKCEMVLAVAKKHHPVARVMYMIEYEPTTMSVLGVDRLSAWPIIGADIKHFTDYRYRPF